jgi:Na+:H+ antiporter, NhaA family
VAHTPQIIRRLVDGSARPEPIDQALHSFHKFIRSQVVGSILLLVCAIVALIWANSPFAPIYHQIWDTVLSITLGDEILSLTLHQWVNEGLMMSFFLLVGLEIKQQILVGELSSFRQALFPVSAALGGMIIPALIFVLFNAGTDGIAGWGIPMSTDIAFALGILALLGKRIPISLKVFLAALAIADDLGAILVIAIFYTEQIVVIGLAIAFGFWIILFILSRLGIFNFFIYFVLSVGVWFGFATSGIHATIGGVLVALVIPARSLIDPNRFLDVVYEKLPKLENSGLDNREILSEHQKAEAVIAIEEAIHDVEPPLVQVEHSLQPWVTFVVMPIFALSNAGVTITGNIFETIMHPVSLGVIFGLLIGKQVGITLFSYLMVRFGFSKLPDGLTWRHIHGVSMLAGIGFTVSLFVTELAYVSDHHTADIAKVGILLASFIAGIVGFFILKGVKPVEPITPRPQQDMS